MDTRVKKLNDLRNSLENFKKAYKNLIKTSNKINNVNDLGTVPEYPFCESLDIINMEKWIDKFIKNIDNLSLQILIKNDELLTKEEVSKYLNVTLITLERKVKKYEKKYKQKGYYYIKPDNSNGKKCVYTKEFCDFLKEIDQKKKKVKNIKFDGVKKNKVKKYYF